MTDGVKLSALLPDNLEQAGRRAAAALREREDIACLNVGWDMVSRELEGALGRALDCDVLAILAECWAKSRLLSDYADPVKHPPGERSVLEIGGHELTREVHPVIAVTIGSCPCVELRFTFAVTAHLGGVQLIVSDGHIRGGSLGEAWARAELRYGEVPLHSPADSRKIALGGEFRLAEPGVRIPRLGGAAAGTALVEDG